LFAAALIISLKKLFRHHAGFPFNCCQYKLTLDVQIFTYFIQYQKNISPTRAQYYHLNQTNICQHNVDCYEFMAKPPSELTLTQACSV